jgi:hypothetical protein
MHHFYREMGRQHLRPLKVGDPAEGVVQNSILDLALAQLPGQIAVAIAMQYNNILGAGMGTKSARARSTAPDRGR